MHDYRGTTNLWFGYDPSAPVALPQKVNSKFEKIKSLRQEIATEQVRRRQAEKDLKQVRQNIEHVKRLPQK